jgi:hypothetical protein
MFFLLVAIIGLLNVIFLLKRIFPSFILSWNPLRVGIIGFL